MTAHRERSYTEACGRQALPLTEEATVRSILLPLFPQMAEAEQDQMAGVLRNALDK